MVEKSLAADLWLTCDNCCLLSLYKRFIGRKYSHAAALCSNIFLKIFIFWEYECSTNLLLRCMRAIYSSWNSQIRYEKMKSNLMHVTNPENKCVEYKISSSYGILKVDLTFLKVQQLSFQCNVKVQNISQIIMYEE